MTNPKQASLLRPVLTYELRVLRADAAFWLVLVLLAASVIFAVQTGTRHWQEHARLVAAAKAEENTRLATLRNNLAQVEAGRLVPASPFRDPRSAMWVGLTHGATQVALAPAPLAVAAVGLSDLHPPTVKVSARTKDEFLFADEIRNPLHLLAGAVDLAFVLVFVLPLALLALTYNLVSGERERGTLALMACTGADVRRVMAAKLAVRVGVPTLVTLTVVVVALASAGVPLASPALAALVLATLLYAAFWAGLAAWVNSRNKSSEHNALALAAAWIGLVLVLPALVNTAADALYPTPSRAEMVLAVRGATVSADRERDASLARYREEHPQAQPDELRRGTAAERVARRLAVVDASAMRVEAVVESHDAQLTRRQALVDAVAFLSPALLMQLAVTDLAGTGSARYAAFYRQVDTFHTEWRDFFLGKARKSANLTAADYAALPRYAGSTPGTPIGTTAPRFLGLSLLAALAAALAWQGLHRCERR